MNLIVAVVFGIVLGVVIVVVGLCINIAAYNKTAYRAITQNTFFTVMTDKGKRGEYELYKSLRCYEDEGYKFLFNLYLSKEDGKTTELDVVMITNKVVFVFESKNYKGWIFGNDKQKYWTQCLYNGNKASRKEKFYNPVWQNRTHCKTLQEYLPLDTEIVSVVLFSNDCELKKLTVSSSDVMVAKRDEAKNIVDYVLENSLSHDLDIAQIYEMLFPYSQVSCTVKQKHIEDISKYK